MPNGLVLRYFIHTFLSRPPFRAPSARTVPPCHGGARAAHLVVPLGSVAFGLVGRRTQSTVAAIRARTADGWTTFCGDEAGTGTWCAVSSVNPSASR
jgi:hypothetical protein